MKIKQSFETRVRAECASIAEMLIEKRAAYGDSATNPLRVFSRSAPLEQLRVRIDDKLSRVARGREVGEDTVLDLIGYLLLYRLALAAPTPDVEEPDEVAAVNVCQACRIEAEIHVCVPPPVLPEPLPPPQSPASASGERSARRALDDLRFEPRVPLDANYRPIRATSEVTAERMSAEMERALREVQIDGWTPEQIRALTAVLERENLPVRCDGAADELGSALEALQRCVPSGNPSRDTTARGQATFGAEVAPKTEMRLAAIEDARKAREERDDANERARRAEAAAWRARLDLGGERAARSAAIADSYPGLHQALDAARAECDAVRRERDEAREALKRAEAATWRAEHDRDAYQEAARSADDGAQFEHETRRRLAEELDAARAEIGRATIERVAMAQTLDVVTKERDYARQALLDARKARDEAVIESVEAARVLAGLRCVPWWYEELSRHDTLSLDSPEDRATLARALVAAVERAGGGA